MNNNMNVCIYLFWQYYIAGVSLSMYIGLNRSYTLMNLLGSNFSATASRIPKFLHKKTVLNWSKSVPWTAKDWS